MASAAPAPDPRRLLSISAGEREDDPAALCAATLADAAGHIADGLPELLVLARRSQPPSRPRLNEAIHCLASGLEAALDASHIAEAQLDGAERGSGEAGLLVMLRAFLDQRP